MVKNGFSLVEALVVMIIVSIIFTASTKVITQRPRVKVERTAHGYYECFIKEDNRVYSHLQREGAPTNNEHNVEATGSCRFNPPTGVAFFNFNAYVGGFYSGYEPNIENDIIISISRGADVESSRVTLRRADNGNTITLTYGLGNLVSEDLNPKESEEMYIQGLFPESGICNDGDFGRPGFMISW